MNGVKRKAVHYIVSRSSSRRSSRCSSENRNKQRLYAVHIRKEDSHDGLRCAQAAAAKSREGDEVLLLLRLLTAEALACEAARQSGASNAALRARMHACMH